MVDRRSETSWTLPEHRIGRDGMPFCEVSAMAQKREFVMFALNEGANVRELCRRFGISPTTGYKWIERYQAEGLAGLTAIAPPALESAAHRLAG
ncbi:helix-turn-helix domain-containing protein [Mesorhizobium sp. B2-4-12]|nr:helix-turn-helix domain-containing protein [Mesorhizobium sp. B2-4-12]